MNQSAFPSFGPNTQNTSEHRGRHPNPKWSSRGGTPCRSQHQTRPPQTRPNSTSHAVGQRGAPEGFRGSSGAKIRGPKFRAKERGEMEKDPSWKGSFLTSHAKKIKQRVFSNGPSPHRASLLPLRLKYPTAH